MAIEVYYQTTNSDKIAILQGVLPHVVHAGRPLYEESAIAEKQSPQSSVALFIAEGKALDDFLARTPIMATADRASMFGLQYTTPDTTHIALYSDAVRMVTRTGEVLFQPRDAIDMLHQLEVQSGERVEFVVGHAALRLDGQPGIHMASCMVIAETYMKPFDPKETLQMLIDTQGIESLAGISGTIPLERATHLFDQSTSLVVRAHFDTGANSRRQGSEVVRLESWEHLGGDDLKPFYAGAFPQVLDELFSRLT